MCSIEEINIPTLWGIKISNEDESIETSSTLYSSTFNEIGEEKLEVSLFDKIRLKTINVNVIEDVDVIPVGEIVGIKLYTNGVMVVGMASIEGEDGNIYKPYQDTGIQEGDFDNVGDCKYSIPSHWDIGKVYKRLIKMVAADENIGIVDALIKVYNSFISAKIDDYNSSVYYENPSYIFESYRENRML